MNEKLSVAEPTPEENAWSDALWDLNSKISGSWQSPTDDGRKAAVAEADALAAEIFAKHGTAVHHSLKNDLAHSYELAKEHGLVSEASHLEKFAQHT